MGLMEKYNKKDEFFRIAGGALKVKNQRPLAPSNLRGGANMQWGKGLARTRGQDFQNYETQKECPSDRRVVEYKRKNYTNLFKSHSNFANGIDGRV